MKYYIYVLFIFFSSNIIIGNTIDWGATGHRVVGEVAQKHLSRKTKIEINKLLNGASLAFVSTYADEIKSDVRYREFGPWHYVNFPFNSKYEEHPKSDKGDIIVAINTCVEILKNEKSTQEEKVFYLKLLVHFIGDLHQPLHVGLAEDRGANNFQVRWFDEGTNLHTVWDTNIIDSYNMSYTELAENTNVLSGEELNNIKSGNVIDWMYESRELCQDIYSKTKVGENLSYNYMYEYVNVVRGQLQKGGIRLATLLNDIFG
jgi:hypothetical protein